jgi:23S rRNA pseudouridine1911/1915/1917 synthase
MLEFQVNDKQSGRMLKNLLRSDYQISSRLINKLLRIEGITRNGKVAHLLQTVNKGDVIKVMLPREESEVQPENMTLAVRYEDDEILVVNKSPGMLVHPSAKEREGSLLAGVAAYLQPKGLVPHSVHRLDRDTSGLVMFAKHAHAHHLFDVALRKGNMHRAYCAIVHLADDGPGMRDWQAIQLPIGQDPGQPSRRIISADGQRAVTHVRVIANVGPIGIAQVVLETGRTHQIRLHLASIGMPILGEPHYRWHYSMQPTAASEDTLENTFDRLTAGLSRQALHAYRLEWKHPVTKQTQVVLAPLADDLKRYLSEEGMTESAWTLVRHTLSKPELPGL